MLVHEIENRHAFVPSELSKAMSSAVRLYESQVTTPEELSAISPGISQKKVSQMLWPRPSLRTSTFDLIAANGGVSAVSKLAPDRKWISPCRGKAPEEAAR